jgi:hypothetical protein
MTVDFVCLLCFGMLKLFLPGNLKEEEEVLQWLTLQKNEDTIENVNKQILEKKIEESEYLAAFFCK